MKEDNKKKDSNTQDKEKNIIDEIIDSLGETEITPIDTKSSLMSDDKLVEEEYDILMDTQDPNYFMYCKNK